MTMRVGDDRRMVMPLKGVARQSPQKVASVIEPDPLLADTLHDRLSSWGYRVARFATHRAAADAVTLIDCVDVLAATVPASDEDRPGAYLEIAASKQEQGMGVILMLSDPAADREGVPAQAVEILKPFTCEQLRDALRRAEGAVSTSSRET